MANWPVVALREVSLKTSIIDPAKSPYHSFRYIDVSAVSSTLWKITDTKSIDGVRAPSRARKLVREGDVLFATVRPTLKRVALVPSDLDGQIASTGFCVLRADQSKADPHFIYYTVLTNDFIRRIAHLERGASYPAVSDGDVLRQSIALPSLIEQRQICLVLSKIQSAIEVRERLIAALKELKMSTMVKLFREGLRGETLKSSELGEIPQSWDVAPLEDVTESSVFGPRFSASLYHPDGAVATLRTTDIDEDGSINYSGLPRARLPLDRFRHHFLVEGDLVVTRSGTCGIAAVYERQQVSVIPGAFLIRVRLRPRASSHFLRLWINSAVGRPMIEKLASGAVQKNISGTSLARLMIPIPENHEQESIIRHISLIERRLLVAKKRCDNLKHLFSTAIHLLMTGQVRVKQGVRFDA